MDYDIAEAFRRIELELISSMKRNWQRHNEEENKYGFTWSRWQAEQLKSLEEFKKKNPRLFSSEFKAINEQFLDSILGQKETNFFGVHSRKVQALVKATTGDLVKAEHAMLRKANDEYRKVIYNAQTYLASGAGTLDKAVDMASNDFLTRGINCVVYKGGRHVNMATYSEMSLRTTNKRIGMYADGAKRQELGVHTVKVSRYGMCSKTCQPWQGRVYVDDVYSGGTPEEAEELNLPLLSTAISGGLFHPNCKHHLSTYYPGMDNDDDGDPRHPTYENPPGTQEHHYLQHQIQRERRLQVGSLSEDKIREHANKEQRLVSLDRKYKTEEREYTEKIYSSKVADAAEYKTQEIKDAIIDSDIPILHTNVSEDEKILKAVDSTDSVLDKTNKGILDKDIYSFIQDGVRYDVDGKNVQLTYTEDELITGELIAKKLGVRVQMMPRVHGKYKNVNTPDYLVDGVYRYDRKEVKGSSKDYVYNVLHKHKKQAECFVLVLTDKSSLSSDELEQQIVSAFENPRLKTIDRVTLTTPDKILKVFDREK